MATTSKPTPGIEIRHGRGCPGGGACRCEPVFRAWAYDRNAKQKVRKTFATVSAAKAWRADAIGEVRRGKLRAVPAATLRAAAEAWLAGVNDGSIRNRSGDVYKPSVIRGYESSLEHRILPELGARRISEITRDDLQDLADRLLAGGLDPSTIRNHVMPLRSIFRRLVGRSDSGVTINPTVGLELPAVRGTRDRVAEPGEATQLLAALPAEDRTLWACPVYAGLRRGELQALRFEDVDLAAGVIRVERSWDVKDGPVSPKSDAGRRTVPISAVLRDYLIEHKLRLGWSEGLFFGRSANTAFNVTTIAQRAKRTWLLAGLQPISLHECRHTYASLMVAAGVAAKPLSTYMGHSSVSITLDRYSHLFKESGSENAALLDDYLERANTQARIAQLT